MGLMPCTIKNLLTVVYDSLSEIQSEVTWVFLLYDCSVILQSVCQFLPPSIVWQLGKGMQ